MRGALLVALLGSASAFVCPPVAEDKLVLKGENEECGGACEAAGRCAEGLKCVTPKTSPFSFAILMGSAKVGTCTRPTVEVKEDESRRLKLAGGSSDVALDDEGVVAAAKFATTYIQARSNGLTTPALSGIVSASQQVVAGIKYTLGLRMSDGHVHRIEVVDTPWLTPRYKVVLFEPNALEAKEESRRLAKVGGSSDVALDDEGVVAAAKFATTYIQARSNGLTTPALSGIVSASKQVVAGIKYTLGLRMSDGHVHRIEVVDMPWLTPRYKVVLFEPNALD